MTIRSIGAMVCGVAFALTTTTGFAQTGGWTPSASATAADFAEHAATMRAEALFGKCKQHYGKVIGGVVWPGASNAMYSACMRNGGRPI